MPKTRKIKEKKVINTKKEREENPIVGGYYINGETICELREEYPDLDDDPDINDEVLQVPDNEKS